MLWIHEFFWLDIRQTVTLGDTQRCLLISFDSVFLSQSVKWLGNYWKKNAGIFLKRSFYLKQTCQSTKLDYGKSGFSWGIRHPARPQQLLAALVLEKPAVTIRTLQIYQPCLIPLIKYRWKILILSLQAPVAACLQCLARFVHLGDSSFQLSVTCKMRKKSSGSFTPLCASFVYFCTFLVNLCVIGCFLYICDILCIFMGVFCKSVMFCGVFFVYLWLFCVSLLRFLVFFWEVLSVSVKRQSSFVSQASSSVWVAGPQHVCVAHHDALYSALLSLPIILPVSTKGPLLQIQRRRSKLVKYSQNSQFKDICFDAFNGALSNLLALCICKVLLWIPKCQELHGGSDELPKHSPTGRWGRRGCCGCARQGANIYISNIKSLLPLPQHQIWR